MSRLKLMCLSCLETWLMPTHGIYLHITPRGQSPFIFPKTSDSHQPQISSHRELESAISVGKIGIGTAIGDRDVQCRRLVRILSAAGVFGLKALAASIRMPPTIHYYSLPLYFRNCLGNLATSYRHRIHVAEISRHPSYDMQLRDDISHPIPCPSPLANPCLSSLASLFLFSLIQVDTLLLPTTYYYLSGCHTGTSTCIRCLLLHLSGRSAL